MSGVPSPNPDRARRDQTTLQAMMLQPAAAAPGSGCSCVSCCKDNAAERASWGSTLYFVHLVYFVPLGSRL